MTWLFDRVVDYNHTCKDSHCLYTQQIQHSCNAHEQPKPHCTGARLHVASLVYRNTCSSLEMTVLVSYILYCLGNHMVWIFRYIKNISPSACPVGTYSDGKGYPCQLCPANSEATQTGVSECPCVLHYYRVASEGPSVACTSEFLIIRSSRLMHAWTVS